MSKTKVNVLVVFGGRSAEHEVSVVSASSVLTKLDRNKFSALAAGIDRQGRFFLHPNEDYTAGSLKKTAAGKQGQPLLLCPGQGGRSFQLQQGAKLEPLTVDAVFPVLHGTFGEDGTIQGLLEMLPVAYVGCGVLGSALSMDKGRAKQIMQQLGLPVLPFKVISQHDWQKNSSACLENCLQSLPLPLFVKPCNLGSSIGISKVSRREQLQPAIDEALRYDQRVIVEQGLTAREIECSVLGNQDPQASLPGEVIPAREFYDYQAKYISDDSELVYPAKLDAQLTEEVRRLALCAFTAVGGEGLARVDLLLDKKTLKPYVSEVNGIPGFTAISMYPKLWEATGVGYSELLSRLIELALARFERQTALNRSYSGQTPV